MKKRPFHSPDVEKLHHTPRRFLRAFLIIAIYLITFFILDIYSHQFEELRGVVAWYPPAGLTYTLLLVFGLEYVPVVTIGLFISSLFIYRMPQSPYLLLLWAIIISLIYGIAAWFIRSRVRNDWQLRKLNDITYLVGTTVIISALLAVLSVSSSVMSSAMPRSELIRAIFIWWIGETVGVLTLAPFLLLYVSPALKQFSQNKPVRLPTRQSFPWPKFSVIGQVFSLAFVFYWVFGSGFADEFRPIYIIALPLIWIAMDHGIKGVTAGIVTINFGLTLALWFYRSNFTQLGELQLLLIVNCILGLYMGASVTERRQAEDKLMQERILLRTVIDNLPDAIYVKDIEGRKLLANRADLENIGKPEDEVLGKTDWDVFPSDVASNFSADDQMIMQSGQTVMNREEYLVNKNGQSRWLITSKLPLFDSEGQITGLVGIGHDITDRKRSEDEINELNSGLEKRVAERTRELRETQEQLVRHEKLVVLGQLAGGVAHELRNPLSVINGAVYYLNLIQPDVSDKIKQYHSRIEQEVHNAEKIITDLLSFTRAISIDLQPVFISDLVQSVLIRYPVPSIIKATLNLPNELPKVVADPQQMEQVIANLIINAYQAMPEGGNLTISASQQLHLVALDIKDTGMGIPPNNMKKLFEPLFTTKTKGIGLGLAISKKLTEANGGRIEVQSEPDKGSKFTLYLPVHIS